MENLFPVRTFVVLALSIFLMSCEGHPTNQEVFNSVKLDAASSTLSFPYHGRKITQTNIVGCGAFARNDGVVRISDGTVVDGDRHWFKRDDSSIIIFPELSSCLKNRPVGQRQDPILDNREPSFPYEDTFIFDSSDHPTKVDVVTSNAFVTPPNDPTVTSFSLQPTDTPITHNLSKAFPGLKDFDEHLKQLRAVAQAGGIVPGLFIGIRASATLLAPNTKCGTTETTGIVVLQAGDFCHYSNNCAVSRPTSVCGKPLGGLHVTYNKSFDTATVVTDNPDPKYRYTLLDSRLPVFAIAPGRGALNYRKWTPSFCVGGHCLPPLDWSVPELFYYPAKNLLIEVAPVQQNFETTMFSGRR